MLVEETEEPFLKSVLPSSMAETPPATRSCHTTIRRTFSLQLCPITSTGSFCKRSKTSTSCWLTRYTSPPSSPRTLHHLFQLRPPNTNVDHNLSPIGLFAHLMEPKEPVSLKLQFVQLFHSGQYLSLILVHHCCIFDLPCGLVFDNCVPSSIVQTSRQS